ncbi:MAG: hypothetical protein QXI19_02710 [Candidatus Caldarchaeum sp.]
MSDNELSLNERQDVVSEDDKKRFLEFARRQRNLERARRQKVKQVLDACMHECQDVVCVEACLKEMKRMLDLVRKAVS